MLRELPMASTAALATLKLTLHGFELHVLLFVQLHGMVKATHPCCHLSVFSAYAFTILYYPCKYKQPLIFSQRLFAIKSLTTIVSLNACKGMGNNQYRRGE